MCDVYFCHLHLSIPLFAILQETLVITQQQRIYERKGASTKILTLHEFPSQEWHILDYHGQGLEIFAQRGQ